MDIRNRWAFPILCIVGKVKEIEVLAIYKTAIILTPSSREASQWYFGSLVKLKARSDPYVRRWDFYFGNYLKICMFLYYLKPLIRSRLGWESCQMLFTFQFVCLGFLNFCYLSGPLKYQVRKNSQGEGNNFSVFWDFKRQLFM